MPDTEEKTEESTSGAKQPLKDTFPVKFKLEESESGRVKLKGVVAKVGEATENGRVYPREVMEEEIERLQPRIENRSLFGELDHPSGIDTSLSNASHLVTDLYINDKGEVIGEFEILEGTDAGENLKAIAEQGAQVGVSTRGEGSLKSGKGGNSVVQNDYRMVTLDVVADPAVVDAKPEVIRESLQKAAEKRDKNLEDMSFHDKLQMLQQEEPEFVEQFKERIREKTEEEVKKEVGREMQGVVQERVNEAEENVQEQIKEDVEKRIVKHVDKIRDEVREQVRSELMSDPEIGRAKRVVETIKEEIKPFLVPEDKEGVVEAKEAEISELEEAVRKARKVIEDQQAKLNDLQEEDDQYDVDESYIEELEKENEKLRNEIDGINEDLGKVASNAKDAIENLRDEKEKAEEQRDEIARTAQKLACQVVIERELSGYELSSQVRRLIDRADLEDPEETRELVRDIKDDLAEKEESVHQEARKKDQKIDQIQEEVSNLRDDLKREKEEKQKFQNALGEALEAAQDLGLQAKIEQRLNGEPNRNELRREIDMRDPDDMEEVEEIISNFNPGSNGRGSQLYQDVQNEQQNLNSNASRESVTGNRESLSESAEKSGGGGNRSSNTQDESVMGVNMGELRELSGIDNDEE